MYYFTSILSVDECIKRLRKISEEKSWYSCDICKNSFSLSINEVLSSFVPAFQGEIYTNKEGKTVIKGQFSLDPITRIFIIAINFLLFAFFILYIALFIIAKGTNPVGFIIFPAFLLFEVIVFKIGTAVEKDKKNYIMSLIKNQLKTDSKWSEQEPTKIQEKVLQFFRFR